MMTFTSLSRTQAEHINFKELYKGFSIEGDLKLGYSLFYIMEDGYKQWNMSSTSIQELKNIVDRIT